MVFTPFWSSPPATYRELVTLYEKQFNESIARGEFVPYVWPYRSFGVYLVLAYLLLPPTSSRVVFYARYPVFAFLIYWSVKAAIECRSAAFAGGYGIGLLNAWAILWLSSLLVFNDARGEFRRIERAEIVARSGGESSGGDTARSSTVDAVADGQEARSRHPNGSISKKPQRDQTSDANWTPASSTSTAKPSYTWQPLPLTLRLRLNWVADLVSNFRGLGWSHQIQPTPSPPPHILTTLSPSPTPTPATISTGISRYPTSRSLLRKTLTSLLLGYLALDMLKVVMMVDPYFWGLTTSPPPPYLPDIIRDSEVLTRSYRLLLSLAAAYTALHTIFALAAPCLVGVFGAAVLGPRGEAWQYPDHYGSYANVFRKGLAGWWGGWWHQTFRFAFEAPQRWIVRKLGWAERGIEAKTLGLVVAFTCSGCLHAAGSATMWPPTRPLRGPFMFFALQPLGIAAQMGISQLLHKTGFREKMPVWVRGLGNFVAVHVWFYYTAPFLTDDFARGGVWLFEPLPVSLVRGLGLGAEGEGWWCWRGRLVWWWWGERWWESGVAF